MSFLKKILDKSRNFKLVRNISAKRGHELQLKTLKRLLIKAQFTEFGKIHDFEKILQSSELDKDFRKAVKPGDYLNMLPWWERSRTERRFSSSTRDRSRAVVRRRRRNVGPQGGLGPPTLYHGLSIFFVVAIGLVWGGAAPAVSALTMSMSIIGPSNHAALVVLLISFGQDKTWTARGGPRAMLHGVIRFETT